MQIAQRPTAISFAKLDSEDLQESDNVARSFLGD